jgi:hypothetical protein
VVSRVKTGEGALGSVGHAGTNAGCPG